MRALSSVGSELLPYKQGVTGSNPVGPTSSRKSMSQGMDFFWLSHGVYSGANSSKTTNTLVLDFLFAGAVSHSGTPKVNPVGPTSSRKSMSQGMDFLFCKFPFLQRFTNEKTAFIILSTRCSLALLSYHSVYES